MKQKNTLVSKDGHPLTQETHCNSLRELFLRQRERNWDGDRRSWGQLILHADCPQSSMWMCACWKTKMVYQTERLFSGSWSPNTKREVTCPCQSGITAGLTEGKNYIETQMHLETSIHLEMVTRGLMRFPSHCNLYFLLLKAEWHFKVTDKCALPFLWQHHYVSLQFWHIFSWFL